MENRELEKYADRIKQDFPDLEINSINFLGEGWFSVAVLINNKFVFRLPGKHDLKPGEIEKEIKILKHLAGKLPVAIPEPCYIAPDLSYFSYPFLPGALANNAGLTEPEKVRLRAEWIKIVESIQSNLPVEQAKALGVRYQDATDSIENIQRINSIPDLEGSVLAFAEQVVAEARKYNTPLPSWKYVHGDIHGFNLLVDEQTHQITGVLDWTSTRIAPFEAEFAVWEWDDIGVIEEVVKAYEQKTGVHIDIDQAKLWRHVDELSDLVELSEADDTDEMQTTKAHIERWIGQAK